MRTVLNKKQNACIFHCFSIRRCSQYWFASYKSTTKSREPIWAKSPCEDSKFASYFPLLLIEYREKGLHSLLCAVTQVKGYKPKSTQPFGVEMFWGNPINPHKGLEYFRIHLPNELDLLITIVKANNKFHLNQYGRTNNILSKRLFGAIICRNPSACRVLNSQT